MSPAIEALERMPKSLRDAIEDLKRNPAGPVVAEVEGMVVELRIQARCTADDIFQEVGAWEGESGDELVRTIREAREQGGAKAPVSL